MKLIGNIGGFFYLATSIAALGSYKKKIEALKAAGKQEEERQVIDLGKVEGLGSIAGIAGRQVTNTGSNGTEALVGRVEDTVQEIAECKFPIAFFGDHFFPCLPSKLEDGIMLRIVCGKAYFNLLCKRIARL